MASGTRQITFTRRLPPGLAVCTIALGSAALVLVLQTLNPETSRFPLRLQNHGAILLTVFGVSGCFVGLGKNSTIRLVFLGIQIMVIWLFSIPYSDPFAVSIFLVLAVIAQSTLVLSFSWVLIIAMLASTIVVASPKDLLVYGIYVTQPAIQLRLLFVLATIGFTGFAIGLRRVHLRAFEAEEMQSRLEEALTRLAGANMKLQDYSTIAERQAMEEERKRIAQEMHDILGHTLTTVNMTLQAAIGTLKDSDQVELVRMLDSARDHVKDGMVELRRALKYIDTSTDYLPYNKNRILDLTKNVTQATGIEITVDFGNTGPFREELRASTIFRIVQEGITNALRHSDATHMNIHFQQIEYGLMIYIRDNGKGVGTEEPGFGITSMRKRVLPLRGTVKIGPNHPRGTTLQVCLPTAK